MKKFRSPSGWTAKQRHSAYTDKSGGPDACWPWVGARNKAGYGIFSVDGDCVLAHRKAYEFEHGPIPDGLKILHECDNRPCQNPSHLLLGTQADNVADMVKKGRGRKAAGEGHGLAKLDSDAVREIRASLLSAVTLSKRYSVNSTTIDRIRQGRTWRHVR